MRHHSRKTQALINLSALKDNYKQLADLAPHSKTIAVIKANAYGHGAIEVAKSLHSLVPAFAVAFVDEAMVLRKAGITNPILILEGPLEEADFALAEQNNFWLMLHNPEQVLWLQQNKSVLTVKFWLKVDTGMNRLGFSPLDAEKVISQLTTQQKQTLTLCSHFSNADEIDNPKTQTQITRLKTLAKKYSTPFSLANSAGIINWPESYADFNRLGIALYGTFSTNEQKKNIKLSPVMTLQSAVIALRHLKPGDSVGYGATWQAKENTVIATIAIGYADGYSRMAKTGTPVFINNQLASLVGRVSMDMITVDVTNLKNIKIGDVVELWGENLPVELIAENMNTINYELLSCVSARVPRIYLNK